MIANSLKVNSSKIVIIDPRVEEYKLLANGVVSNTQVIILDGDRDGVEQITEVLQKSSDRTEVHIVSHGSPGCLYLGNTELSLYTLKDYAEQLQTWFSSSIFLYGCNVAAGDAGEELIGKLKQLTGAKIAASANRTGNAALGGDWQLEKSTQPMQISLAFLPEVIASYSGVFAAPTFSSATVNGDRLVINLSESDGIGLSVLNPPPATAFTVNVNGAARTVTGVTISAIAPTAILTLASAVNAGDTVTVAYNDPTAANDALALQDANGIDAASFAAQTVTNVTGDNTAPVFGSATVNGDRLLITLNEANPLDSTNIPATTDFTVNVNGAPRIVNSVDINATAKTATLTLASAVNAGETVTVAYTDPTVGVNDLFALQDAAGNDTASFVPQTVTNVTVPDTTPPVFDSATVNGNQLVIIFTEANELDNANIPAPTSFTVLVNGTARTVNNLAVNATAKTATLTLASGVSAGDTVTVAYTDPTATNDILALQDVAGNDTATFAAQTVTNVTGDNTPPVFASATVDGNRLVITLTEANALDSTNIPAPTAFTVLVNGAVRAVAANGVAINATAKTATLTLASGVSAGDTVSVAYTDPTAADDLAALQDAVGNDTATFAPQTVSNVTVGDATPPVFDSATVNGDRLVIILTEANTLDSTNIPAPTDFTVNVNGTVRAVAANGVAINATAKTATLTLASAVNAGDTVTVAYNDPTAADDLAALQDAAGNDTATFTARPVTNVTGDTTAPVFDSATVNDNQLVITLIEANALDSTNIPAPTAFTVLVNGAVRAVAANGVAINATAKTATLTLASGVNAGDTVTVAYTDPTNGNDVFALQDAAGNDTQTFAAQPVINNTTATLPVVTFQQDTFSGEEGKKATVTLTRTGDITQASTVRVNINDTGGTATAGQDYDNSSFPLDIQFAANEGQKTFNIGLYSDLTPEPTETISFGLESVNNATVPQNETAVLNITDVPVDTTPLTLNATTIQIAYITYYARPGDPAGLKFWSDKFSENQLSYSPRGNDPLTGNEKTLYDEIVGAFGNSEEQKRLFEGLDTDREKINAIYQFAFDRDGETQGLDFWTKQVQDGNITFVNASLEIGLGAQNEDIMILNNKIDSADLFTNSIDTPLERQAYQGGSAERFGRTFLDNYGLIVSSQSQVDSALEELVRSNTTVA
ncbi:MAG: SwmB domain-containing protein [Prochloraceae cyanobacterium]|nr:SwmB domain-containing protein [Prochloraceae cyanobacterium]